jgi:hypothetical protein
LGFIQPQNVHADNTNYYVDSVSGKDTNSGTSPDQAWQTLTKTSEQTFGPGDKVLLKVGSVFDDQALSLKGSGSKEAPIQLDAYFSATNIGTTALQQGNKPIINTNGKATSGVALVNQSHWRISNLEVTNIGLNQTANKDNGTKRAGISVMGQNIDTIEDVHVDSAYVHDVNGDKIIKDVDNGGIIFWINDDKEHATRFIDASITNSHVANVYRTGISIGASTHDGLFYGYGGKVPEEMMNKYFHRDVVISHNLVENVGGDGIVPMFSYKPLIEYNVSRGACQSGKENLGSWYSAAIWPWRCYDALLQYNEASDTVADYNGDGMAFDCDFSENTTYQYNYSHNNGGGFVLFIQNESLGSVFRYNVSVNDRREIILASNKLPAHFYNNTIYNENPVPIINRVNDSKITLTNNVFAYRLNDPTKVGDVFSGVANSKGELYSDQTFNNNLYVGLLGEEEMKELDPAAKVDTLENTFVRYPWGFDGDGFDGLWGYQLTAASRGINAGQVIKYVTGANGPADPVSGNYFAPTLTVTDFFGQPISETTPDIGAINGKLAQTMKPIVSVKDDDKDPNKSVITVNTATGAKVNLYGPGTNKDVNANADGVATFIIDKLDYGQQSFYVTATAPGKSASESVIASVPAKAIPATPRPVAGISSSSSDNNQAVIVVYTEKGATVTLNDGNSVVKTVVADDDGYATFTVNKQAQAHDYKITAKAPGKDISEATTVTVPAKPTTPPVTPPVTYPSPELTFDDGFVKDATVTQGKSFDPNAGIHAWQDSNHQTAIPAGDWKVDGKVDTSKTGTYTLTYTITNTFGKTTTLTRTIKVVADDSVKYTDINDVVFVQTTKASQYSYDDKTGQFTSNGQLKGLTVATAWKTGRKAVTADGTVYYQVGANGWLRADDVTFSQLAKANGIVDVINPKGAKATDDPMASAKTIQTLPVNTGWKYSAVATNADGTRAYLVADRQWVQAKDVVERASAKAKFVIGKTTAPTFTSDGNVVKNRTLKPGTAWKVTGIKYTNGHVYYRVATDLYVRADYGNFTA